MTPHSDTPRLRRAVQRCLPFAGPWSGDTYRFAAPRWATATELLTGAGGLQVGGRWHPIGLCRVVYASLDPETALAESLTHVRRFQLALRDAMPKTLNAVAARLHRVLDLTNGRVRQRLGLSWERMLGERWWEREADDEEAITQAVGRLAWGAALEGLLVPSAARKGGIGLVCFPDHQLPESNLEIIHAEELPRQGP
jgi:RES domain-containing protein